MVALREKLEKGGKSSLCKLGNTSNAKRTLLSDISIAVKMVIEQKWLSTWIKSQSDKPIPTVKPPHTTILDKLSAEPLHESRFIRDAVISIKVRTVKNTNPVKGQGALRYSRNSSHYCLNGSSERVLVFVSGHRLDKTGPTVRLRKGSSSLFGRTNHPLKPKDEIVWVVLLVVVGCICFMMCDIV